MKTDPRPYACLLLALFMIATPSARSNDATFTLGDVPFGKVLKNPSGKIVFRYMTEKPPDTNLLANSTSCFHPVYTPAGQRITDLAPGDHHHHRGIFLAWHSMQFQSKADFSKLGPLGPTEGYNIHRADFWGWGQFAPTDGRVIENRGVELTQSDTEQAKLTILDDWMIDGKRMMKQVTKVTFREQQGVYVMDLDYQLTPLQDLVLNHTAFGGFCVRARNDGASQFADDQGPVTLPDPHYSVPHLNWPTKAWYDYTIKLDSGPTLGCTVIDHPDNPTSTWHNPRYVWMVNPCIVAKKGLTFEKGKVLRLKYRLVIHDGPPPKPVIQKLSDDFRRN